MFKVTIKFEGSQATLDDIISRVTKIGEYKIATGMATPSNSYADSEALKDSVYNKNVFGFGLPELVPPYNEFGVPVANILHKFGFTTVGQEVVLTNVDARDAAFYRTLQDQLADSGFVIKVEGIDGAKMLEMPEAPADDNSDADTGGDTDDNADGDTDGNDD